MNTNKRNDVHTGCSQPTSLKDILQNIHDDALLDAFHLMDDSHAKVMDHIYDYPVMDQFPEHIRNMLEDIKGNVHLMRKHDYTRDAMRSDLCKLATACAEAIKKEEHREKHANSSRGVLEICPGGIIIHAESEADVMAALAFLNFLLG